MKKYFVLLLTLIAILSFAGIAQAAPRVVLDGQELAFDVPPTVVDGRTLVPLRTIFEALGAEVKWDDATQTATATKTGVEIKLTIGGQAYRNGKPVALDVPAQLMEGRTLVPLRFVSEAMGCKVEWNDESQTAKIKSTPFMPLQISTNFYENKEGKFSIKYPDGWVVKNKIDESKVDSDIYIIIAEPSKEITAQIISISSNIKGNFTPDDILKVYKIPGSLPKYMSKEWEEMSRSKVQINIGEAWLIYGKNMVSGKPSNTYIMLAFANDKLYQTYAWWNTDDWQGSEEAFRAIVCSLKSTSTGITQQSNASPQNLSSALAKEFGSIEGFSGYKFSDMSLSDTIFVDVELNDYDADKRWHALSSSAREDFLRSILHRLMGWFPSKTILISVELVFDYHTWSPDIDDHILSFNIDDGWHVRNAYKSGSAFYTGITDSETIDPDK